MLDPDDGNIAHSKYTDRNGSVVFTDSCAKILAEDYHYRDVRKRATQPNS